MKKSRFNETQIIGVLREQDAGSPTADVCRRHGITHGATGVAHVAGPADLARHVVIGHGVLKEVWPFMSAGDARSEVEIEARMIVLEPEPVRTLLVAGTGVRVLPDFHATDAILEGALLHVLPAF